MDFGFKKIFKRNAESQKPEASPEASPEALDDYGAYGGRFKTAINAHTALNLSTVYRCVEILSNSVAQLPIVPYLSMNHRNRRILYEHPTYRILKNPARNLSKYMFFKMLVQDMLLHGNAYAYIDRDALNNIRQLVYIPAGYVAIDYNYNLFDDITYIVAGFQKIVEHTDMVHLINFTDDGVRGLSTIHHAVQSLQISSESEQSANDAIKSSVTGLLSTEGVLAANQTRDAKKAWEKNVTSNGGIAVLSGGWKFQPLTVNAHDAQLIESRKFNAVDISRWFGVPTTKLGINEGISYNGIEGENLAFLSDTLSPLLQKIEIELERKLYSENERLNIDVKFDVSNLLRVDLKSKAEYYRTLFNIGALTINEIRNELDMEGIEHGDQTYIQSNMTTIEQINAGTAAKDFKTLRL
jgi:HK97 family phage portal protein